MLVSMGVKGGAGWVLMGVSRDLRDLFYWVGEREVSWGGTGFGSGSCSGRCEVGRWDLSSWSFGAWMVWSQMDIVILSFLCLGVRGADVDVDVDTDGSSLR